MSQKRSNIFIFIVGIILIIILILKQISPQLIYKKYKNTILSYNPKIDYKYILAIIEQESYGFPFAIGITKDFGLMQLTKPVLIDYNKKFNTNYTTLNVLINPILNIRIGVWYVNFLHEYFLGDLEKTISSYNKGLGNVERNDYSTDYYKLVIKRYQHYVDIEQRS